jgi:anthranilate synthase/aminodeoxychorismate synthase-like glutamine amidotransferase
MIVLIDNYDSFIYTVARYISELGYAVTVLRNDSVTVCELEQCQPSAIIISPGPCTPSEAGISVPTIQQLGKTIPILGICLGHQAIGQAYGGTIVPALEPMHGKSCYIHHNETSIFTGIENPMQVGRYHSLAIDKKTLPNVLEVNAVSADGEIMAVKHRHYLVFGVQFHPESILTPNGKKLLKNFLVETQLLNTI